MTPQRIQRKRSAGWRLPAEVIIVDRTSRFGNPFRIADAIEANYEQPARACVAHFTAWIEGHAAYQDTYTVGARTFDRRWMREHLSDLAGHDLACTCPPEAVCHANVLLRLANPELACTCTAWHCYSDQDDRRRDECAYCLSHPTAVCPARAEAEGQDDWYGWPV
jgi:hypothetical protein